MYTYRLGPYDLHMAFITPFLKVYKVLFPPTFITASVGANLYV